jgi:hypothetical protein
MLSWMLFTRMVKMVITQDRRHDDGVHGGAIVMETTMIPVAILFII